MTNAIHEQSLIIHEGWSIDFNHDRGSKVALYCLLTSKREESQVNTITVRRINHEVSAIFFNLRFLLPGTELSDNEYPLTR